MVLNRWHSTGSFSTLLQLMRTLLSLLYDGLLRFLGLCLRPSPAVLAAENLFLRKQLALYQRTPGQTTAVPPMRPTLRWSGSDVVRLA